MPRGVRKTPSSIDEQVAELQVKIQHHQSKIADLTAKKKALLASKEKVEMDALYQLVKTSGKSPSELITELANK